MNCGNEMKMKKKKKTVSQPSILVRFSKPSEAINLDLPILKFLQRIQYASKEVSTYRIRKLIARIVADCD